MIKFINTNFFIFVLLIIFLLSCSNQYDERSRKLKKNNGTLKSGDMELFVHEDMINGFLKSMGNISKMNTDGVIHYLMVIKDPYINVFQDSAKFVADIDIFVGEDVEANTKAIGDVIVEYDLDRNMIQVKIVNVTANFHLGGFIDLGHIDISEYFVDPIEFPGPQPKSSRFEILLTDENKKIININIRESNLFLVDSGIRILSQFEFIPE